MLIDQAESPVGSLSSLRVITRSEVERMAKRSRKDIVRYSVFELNCVRTIMRSFVLVCVLYLVRIIKVIPCGWQWKSTREYLSDISLIPGIFVGLVVPVIWIESKENYTLPGMLLM